MFYIVIVRPDGTISYGNYGFPVADFYEACAICDETLTEHRGEGCKGFVADEKGTRLTM